MFKKYPFVKQTGIKDCGVSCLKMLIMYYHGYIDTRKLQEMTKTTKNGTTAFHLIEAAKELGFHATGVRVDINNIDKNNMILPCIANVIIDNKYNHYIVIYDIDYQKKKMLIADPARKLTKITFEEFEKIWTNILLFMYPIKKIPLYTKEQKPLNFLLNIILGYKKIIINVILISLFYTLFSILCSCYFKFITDSLLVTQEKSNLCFIFIIFLILSFVKLISSLFRNHLLLHLNEKINLVSTNYIFRNIIFLPYNYYHNHTTGEIISRMNDLEKIREMISTLIVTVFVDAPLAIISFICLYFISSTLFFIAIILFGLYLIIMLLFLPFFKRHIEIIQNKKCEYTSLLVESISGFESVKGLGIEDDIVKKFENKFIEFVKKIFNFESLYNKLNFIKEFIYDIGTVIIIFIGSLLILDGNLTIGGLLAFNSLLPHLLLPIRNLIENGILFKETNYALQRILDIIEPHLSSGKINKTISGNILFKNLNYSYDDRKQILKNINIRIKSHEKILIIGDSGSGKSTLVKLLLRYYNVERDKIMIDNIDINDYTDSCIKNNICYISQNETLFTDTIYNNITLGKKLENESFLEITKLCYIDDIIKRESTGYNMLIEENGFNLSGGERQRIVLARSLMRNFEILIIDEGLNQIDVNLERKILKNILNKYSNKTICIISHRLENIDLFNRVIEFSNHKIKKDICKNC